MSGSLISISAYLDRRHRLQFRCVTLGVATILFGLCAFGQAPTGTLQGRVADPAGSAIPEAKVTIENQSTGVKQALVTNSDGRFVQPYLASGDYRLTVEVKAEVAQLKTETSSASTTITSKQIHDLPTVRNPFALATLTPGVIPAGGGSTPWISGGRNASSEILIDGNTAIVPENNVSINDGGYTPVIDSVEELTVIKNSMADEAAEA
jgi:hypothetical protein